MRKGDDSFIADAVICAKEAGETLAGVVDRLPGRQLRSVVVVDRGSRDNTAEVGRDAGCLVLRQADGGYGSACKRAIAHLESLPRPPDAVVFIAADGSDPESETGALLAPLLSKSAELVIGVRSGTRAAVVDRVAMGLIGVIYRHRFSALSPFRAVRFPALVALSVADEGSGWDAEMQVKAVTMGLRIAEVPVSGGVRGGHGRGLERTGRMLFRILRHSTAR